ncbi:MAG: outer membrane lipoprotein carrier protein LolA [Deinococcota bacterium]|nr:outer membrane lipoprotein carrier protein LolA [Deinococcota bacterium]
MNTFAPYDKRYPADLIKNDCKRLALLLLTALTLTATAGAQDMSVDAILENLRASADSLSDASFLLAGQLVDLDGSAVDLEIAVRVITDLNLARAEFIQPDALADNFLIVDDEAVYNYLYLTNQVTILNASDPDALGGLIEAGDAELAVDFSTDLSELFDGWEAEVLGYDSSPVGNLYLLRFNNQDVITNVHYVEAQVVEDAWTPYRLVFYEENGEVLADLTFRDFERNPGLDPADLRFIPGDAEVFDER